MARTADPTVRDALIDEAAALLATGGIGALTARRLTNEVGASTTAIYTHFGGMDGLIRAVVAAGFSRLHAELSSAPVTDDPLDDLVGVGRAYRSMALGNAHLYRVMFEINPLSFHDPAEGPSAADRHQGSGADLVIAFDAFGALVAAVQRCIDAEAIEGDATDLATALWAAGHGAVTLELSGLLGDRGRTTFESATGAVIIAALR